MFFEHNKIISVYIPLYYILNGLFEPVLGRRNTHISNLQYKILSSFNQRGKTIRKTKTVKIQKNPLHPYNPLYSLSL